MAVAGSLAAEYLRKKTSNADSGLANVLVGAVFGSLIAIATVLEPTFFFLTEAFRIVLTFLYGAIGRILFVGVVNFAEHVQENPKQAIKELFDILPEGLLGDILDVIKRRISGQKKDDK